MTTQVIEEKPQGVTTSKPEFKIWVKWFQGRERLHFDTASTFWTFGKRKSGKSALSELIGTKYLNNGATVWDLFSSRDAENVAWCRSPYTDILFVTGNSCNVKTEWNQIKVKDLTLKEGEKYQLVITNPRFYKDEPEMYSSLSDIVDLLKWRTVYTKNDLLIIREARRLIASRIVSGKVRSRFEAEEDFIELHSEAEHTGLAACIDSLRPMSIAPDIREVANYVFIKRVGRFKIPREYWYTMRHIKPHYFRRMPLGDFILLTDEDSVGVGHFELVPWHVVRGEDILDKLGIEISFGEKTAPIRDAEEILGQVDTDYIINPRTNRRRKRTPELHRKIVKLYLEGMSVRNIEEKIEHRVTYSVVGTEIREHRQKICVCFADTTVPQNIQSGNSTTLTKVSETA